MSSPDVRVIVLGAGSIGARHAANLRRAGASVAIADPIEGRALAVWGAEPVPFDLAGLGAYDGVVVASPTIYHREQTEAALAAGTRVMVEKPLDVSSRNVDRILTQADRVMVAYNLRLHRPVEDIVGWVHTGRVGRPLTVRLWFGFFLPNWRPTVDYRQTYSARAALGGGVLLDAIHELDLLVWLLGEQLEVEGAVVARVGELEIDTEDTVQAVLRHPEGTVATVSLDYLSRRYRRGIEVIGTEATARLDWARGVLELETEDGVESSPADMPVDRSYEREADAFLSFIRDHIPPPVDGRTGAASLRLADLIREAAR